MVTRLAQEAPQCVYCKRQFLPGAAWLRANYCRAAYLAEFISSHPDLSAWEIAKETNLLYSDVTRGLLKAREWHLVEYEAEQREQGGERFRYHVSGDWSSIVVKWAEDGYI